ncbi:hypothetical protein A2Y85_07730 [candidate division WOR-3 bacterium RBG_13_43_14]|uniref:Uncharacterized protein n=1 Tax=candidate division WOR-3 bacterium RBG_13_43_14 TaxID=1802590 RepID=A0A1F4UAY5_UNCW3|nr:MAG: hypothetical protein A2Y85_07730 [candidate division WOR-3 bacterium RBG_13_43_14]
MKLIEEIKQAEEKAEKLKQEAERKGQKNVDEMLEKMNAELAGLDDEKEELFKEARQQAEKAAKKQIAILSEDHKKELMKLEKNFEKNKNKTIKKMQEIFLKWPSSR